MEITPNRRVKSKKTLDPFYRGLVQTENKIAYYIINELYSDEDSKLFSAAKMTVEPKLNELQDSRYAVKYFSKKWIKEQVFTKFNISEDKSIKFFEALKKSFEFYKKIENPFLIQLNDYIDKEDCIYVITEFCEYSLYDYVQILREPYKNTNYPFEKEIRRIVYQIISILCDLHDKHSLSFGGLLNGWDIQVSEYGKDGNIFQTVKFPHPFLANLQTILKIYKKTGFPSYFAPEILNQFKQNDFINEIIKKDSFDIGSLFAKVNQNFDMWALSYLIYEILFDNPPFVFNSLESALKDLNDNYTYNIYPHQVSDLILKVIENGLKYKHQVRMNFETLKNYLEELKNENDEAGLKELEKKLRAKALLKHDKSGIAFSIGDKNNLQFLNQEDYKI